MSGALDPQIHGCSLSCRILPGTALLVAMIELFRKPWLDAGKSACANCPSQRHSPLSEAPRREPRETRRRSLVCIDLQDVEYEDSATLTGWLF